MLQSKKIALVFLTGITFIESCNSNSNSIIDELTPPKELTSLSSSVVLVNLIRAISNLQFVGDGPIGFEGKQIHTPDYGGMLTSTVDTFKLVKLTSNKSPYVRMFAFKALVIKRYSSLKKILEVHLTDQETYQERAGCLVENVPINVSYFRELFPFLCKTDADFYREAIIKQNKLSGNSIFQPSVFRPGLHITRALAKLGLTAIFSALYHHLSFVMA